MSEEPTSTSNEDLYRRKQSRRRELAALPIEKKIEILVKLQHMANDVGRHAGRPEHKPWDIGKET